MICLDAAEPCVYTAPSTISPSWPSPNLVSLLPHEQFIAHVKRAERPLIVLRETPHPDDFASAFGVAAVLHKLGKQVDILSAGMGMPKNLAFLAADNEVRTDLPNIRSLTVQVNLSSAKVDELSYNVEGDELRIHVTPKHGSWSSEDVRISTTGYRYDLIIMLGVPDVTSLGAVATDYADFFFNTPIINLDHAGANEHHGHLNLVDISAVANGEACFELFSRIDAGLIDEHIATCFLAGMIAKTKSFKTPNVTPKTLKVAGALMNSGAKRDEIVEKLYRTRSVETLRLWGRALARLKADHDHHIAWTLLTKQDFVAAGTSEDALDDIVEELLETTPEAQIIAILYEHADGHVAARLHTERPHDALHLGAPFKASGTREAARLTIALTDIVEAEKLLIVHIKTALSSLTNRSAL